MTLNGASYNTVIWYFFSYILEMLWNTGQLNNFPKLDCIFIVPKLPITFFYKTFEFAEAQQLLVSKMNLPPKRYKTGKKNTVDGTAVNCLLLFNKFNLPHTGMLDWILYHLLVGASLPLKHKPKNSLLKFNETLWNSNELLSGINPCTPHSYLLIETVAMVWGFYIL